MLCKNRIPNFLSVREAVKAMKALADYRIFLDRFEAKGKRVYATFCEIILSPKN